MDGVPFKSKDSAPEGGMTGETTQKAHDSALAGFPNPPKVEVVRNPDEAGILGPVSRIPEGVTLDDGRIFIFADNITNQEALDRVVFHEVVYRGARIELEGLTDFGTMKAIM